MTDKLPPKQVEVKVEVLVNLSEDPEKVIKAVNSVVPGVRVELEGQKPSILRGISNDIKSLNKIYEQIRSRASVSVARRLLLRNSSRDSTWILLNKQAAFMGTVVLCEVEAESALGPILVRISSKSVIDVIDWLAPQV